MSGYVLCLLKYFVGSSDINDTQSSSLNKTVCLGHFGRVELHKVSDFREYQKIAAITNAGFLGNRKQLLLYTLENYKEHAEALISRQYNNSLADSSGREVKPLGCITILRLNPALKGAPNGNANSFKKLVEKLGQLDAIKKMEKNIAMFGLLGSEDICILSCSDSYKKIKVTVEKIKEAATDNNTDIVASTYSILTLHKSENQIIWGDANAEINFTLHNKHGGLYVNRILEKIRETDKRAKMTKKLGEFDLTICCKAEAINESFYASKGMMGYDNEDYRSSILQSFTVISSMLPNTQVKNSLQERLYRGEENTKEHSLENEPGSNTAMLVFIENAINEIKENILNSAPQNGNDILYMSQAFYRSLKDYHRVISFPYGGIAQSDLTLQFMASINAIVHASRIYKRSRREGRDYFSCKAAFDSSFNSIIAALHNTMLASSQVDKLFFEEQQNHLHNTGAYNKILVAYYGIIKSIIKIVYNIKRDCYQPLLIPIIQLGLTPIVESTAYSTSVEGDDALLLVTTMPYQALSNIPKYIGMLVHEVFHYASPQNRILRNRVVGRILCLVSLRSLLSAIIESFHDVSSLAVNDFIQSFDSQVVETANNMFDSIESALCKVYGSLDIESYAFLDPVIPLLEISNAKPGSETYKLYCTAIENLSEAIAGTTDVRIKRLLEHFNNECGACLERAAHSSLYSEKGTNVSWIYRTALWEISPDLFDIKIVMNGKPESEQLLQYYWQLHSIRCDKLFYQASNRNVDSNTLRIGLMTDSLLGVTDEDDRFLSAQQLVRRLKDAFEKWFGCDLSKYTNDVTRMRSQILEDYSKYLDEVFPLQHFILDFKELIIEQINLENNENEEDISILSEFYEKHYSLYREYPDFTQAEAQTKRFDLNISIMEKYQVQPPLRGLQRIKQRADVHEDYSLRPFSAAITSDLFSSVASSPLALSTQMQKASNLLDPFNKKPLLWFRGQGEYDWKHLPNLYRSSLGIDCQGSGIMRLVKNQLHLAKARAGTMLDTSSLGMAEWFTVMQHYSFKTTLLDWSENMHTALYFAIEEWISAASPPKKDASITVFNPVLYNLARNALLEGKQESADNEIAGKRLVYYLEHGYDDYQKYDYALPLFSKDEVLEGEYGRFLRFDLEDSLSADTACKTTQDYPVAAMVQPKHSRALAQSGMFTFFSLYSHKEGNSFDYLDIFEIQNKYLEYLEKAKIDCIIPFAYTICLSALKYEEFVSYAHAMGIRKYNIYPEIDKIAGEINNEVLIPSDIQKEGK